VTPRLTYANVVATVALFIALGGASWAAISLPADSVGSRQLAFPLGVGSRTGATAVILVDSCASHIPCLPVAPSTLATKTVVLKRRSQLLVLGSASVSLSGPSPATSSPVQVDLGPEIRGVISLRTHQLVTGVSPATFWQIVSEPAGRQSIRLEASAQSDGVSVHSVDVYNPQLAIVALPDLP
jgi:hypothetical protein